LNDLVWTTKRLGVFIEAACLSEDEKEVLIDWVDHRSPAWTAEHRSMSDSKVGKLRTRIRRKYDLVQAEYPEVFPPRIKPK
jgi:DNA-binding CsgD family transcriptional regulator